jgi:Family of unknown function (DUF6788)
MIGLDEVLDQAECRSAQTVSDRALPKTGAPRGSLQAEMKTCGRPGCRCARGELHGPYHYLFWRDGGRLRKRYARPSELAAVRAEIADRRARLSRAGRACSAALEQWRALRDGVREVERHG